MLLRERRLRGGRYLSFIATHYERLPAAVVFVQADWFDRRKGDGLKAPRFDFWQTRCVALMHGAHPAGISRLKQLANDAADDGMGAVVGAVAAQPTWADYLPLGQRNTHWPPRVVTRSSRSSSYAVPEANFDECLRHMLQLAGLAVPLPGSLNLTFYASNNFIASRRRLRNSPRAAWSALADQFVAQGVCVPRALRSATANATEAAASRLKPENGCADESCCGRSRASRWLCHSARLIAKSSLGHGSEVLQHAIFGGHPVEHAPLSSAKSFPSGPNACAR